MLSKEQIIKTERIILLIAVSFSMLSIGFYVNNYATQIINPILNTMDSNLYNLAVISQGIFYLGFMMLVISLGMFHFSAPKGFIDFKKHGKEIFLLLALTYIIIMIMSASLFLNYFGI